MRVDEVVARNRAIRDYNGAPLADGDMMAILEAARLAPSSLNRQPWQFIAIRDRQTLARLCEFGNYAEHLRHSALTVVLVLESESDHPLALFDAGQAAANMQLVALEKGIGSCPVRLKRSGAAKDLLGIPADRYAELAIAFGYPTEERLIQDPIAQSSRRALDEVVYWERWRS